MLDRTTITISEAWAGKTDCLSCQIRESALFAGLNERDFEAVHEPITQIILEPGQRLYNIDDSGKYIYTVRSGMLKLSQFLPDGTQRIVRVIKTADVVGLEALLGNRYQHEVGALQETELCKIPVSVIEEISKVNPHLQRSIIERCQRALANADTWLTELSTGPSKQRVARLILCLVQDKPKRECQLCTREDMGAMLGITTESASRVIAEFKRQGHLKPIDSKVVQVDVSGLEEVANG